MYVEHPAKSPFVISSFCTYRAAGAVWRHTLRPLALAASVALAAAALPQAVMAQAAVAIDIPAQALGSALNEWARQAGLQLLANPELVSGKQAPAISGTFSAEQALEQLLAGSGLVAQRNGAVVTLQRSAPVASGNAAARALPEVTVTAAPTTAGTTEDSGSYTTDRMNTATGLNLSMRRTPQSVTVLSRQQMDEQNIASLEDAMQSVTGVVSNSGYYTGNSGAFVSRGIAIGQIQYDGVATSTGANGTFNADNGDMSIYDRVEVVRGATGLMQGTGQPSASINLVRKRPTTYRRAAVTASVGSWSQRRLMLDGSTPINESGTIRARGVVNLKKANSYQDYANSDGRMLYGIVEADLGTRTMLTLGGQWSRDKDIPVTPFPTQADGSFYPLSRSANLGNAFDYWHQTDKNAFAELEHRFDSGWKAKWALTKRWTDVDMMFTSLVRTDGQLYQNIQGYTYESEQTSTNLQANGPFELLGRTHELIVGASYRRRINPVQGGGWIPTAERRPIGDPLAWDAGSAVMPDNIDYGLWKIAPVRSWEAGTFLATRLSLTDALTAVVGVRNSNPYNFESVVTPYYGFVLDIDGHHSVYASRTQTHQPVSTVDINGDVLKPVTGTNLEVGIKGEYFDKRLNTSLALFQMRQRNRVMQDRDGPTPCPSNGATWCSISAGEIKSQGFELEASGEVQPGWNVAAGYTYVSAKYVSDNNAANIGKPVDTDSPRRQFKLATSYRLPGELHRWTLGSSVYAQSAIYSGDIRQGGYTRVGLNAAYQYSKELGVRVNVDNVFDRDYYQFIGWSTGGNRVGAPRSVSATLNYQF